MKIYLESLDSLRAFTGFITIIQSLPHWYYLAMATSHAQSAKGYVGCNPCTVACWDCWRCCRVAAVARVAFTAFRIHILLKIRYKFCLYFILPKTGEKLKIPEQNLKFLAIPGFLEISQKMLEFLEVGKIPGAWKHWLWCPAYCWAEPLSGARWLHCLDCDSFLAARNSFVSFSFQNVKRVV